MRLVFWDGGVQKSSKNLRRDEPIDDQISDFLKLNVPKSKWKPKYEPFSWVTDQSWNEKIEQATQPVVVLFTYQAGKHGGELPWVHDSYQQAAWMNDGRTKYLAVHCAEQGSAKIASRYVSNTTGKYHLMLKLPRQKEVMKVLHEDEDVVQQILDMTKLYIELAGP
jgi:hypothetical protein